VQPRLSMTGVTVFYSGLGARGSGLGAQGSGLGTRGSGFGARSPAARLRQGYGGSTEALRAEAESRTLQMSVY